MLEIKKLRFGFKDKLIFENLSLKFEPNKITGIVGRNGIGKTTLFRVIAGLLQAQEGEISYNKSAIHQDLIGFLPTTPYFYPYMKGREYLQLILEEEQQLETNLKYAKQLNLPMDNLTDTYSTGMQKKLAFSTVISQNRPIQIFDEPFNGVDLEGNEIQRYILKHNQIKKITIVSSHILSSFTDLCDSIYYIHENFDVQLFSKNEFPLLQNMVKREIKHGIGLS